MNAFESGTRRCIPAVLVYLEHQGRVLLIHKGKYNGVGGKLEPDESPLEAALRETREEAGVVLLADQLQLAGTVQFPKFKVMGRSGGPEDWWVYLWRATLSDRQVAQVRTECEEGKLQWFHWSEVGALPMWEGDALFLPKVREGRPVFGTVWYEQGRVTRSWFSA